MKTQCREKFNYTMLLFCMGGNMNHVEATFAAEDCECVK